MLLKSNIGRALFETNHHVQGWRGGVWREDDFGLTRNFGGELLWDEKTCNKVVVAGLNKLLDATFKTGLASPAWYVGLAGQSIADAAITAGLEALTSASNPWTAADAGSALLIAGAGAPANGFPTDFSGSITTYNSAGSVTTNANAGATVAAAAAIWGPRPTDTMASHAPWSLITAYSNATNPAFTPGAIANGSVDNTGSPAIFNINGGVNIGGLFLTDNNAVGGATGTLYGMAVFTAFRALTSGDTASVTSTVTAAAS